MMTNQCKKHGSHLDGDWRGGKSWGFCRKMQGTLLELGRAPPVKHPHDVLESEKWGNGGSQCWRAGHSQIWESGGYRSFMLDAASPRVNHAILPGSCRAGQSAPRVFSNYITFCILLKEERTPPGSTITRSPTAWAQLMEVGSVCAALLSREPWTCRVGGSTWGFSYSIFSASLSPEEVWFEHLRPRVSLQVPQQGRS